MKATYFDEPELEFSGGRHIDIRFGLSTFGAFDRGTSLAPSKIRLGIVGDQESIDKFTSWVGKCRSGIDAKASALPTLFPGFSGFGEGRPFCDIICDPQLARSINSRDIRALASLSDRDEVVHRSIERYISESHDLCQNTPCDVVVCLVPAELLKPIDMGVGEESGPRSRRKRSREGVEPLTWHDLLKAKSMTLNVPVQMARPATYGGKSIDIGRMVRPFARLKTRQRGRGISLLRCTTKLGARRGAYKDDRLITMPVSSGSATITKSTAITCRPASPRFLTSVVKES